MSGPTGFDLKVCNLRREHSGCTNIMPLQTGGLLTEAAKRAVLEFGDGYSVCDFCSGDLHHLRKPPVTEFVHEVLPAFLGCEVAALTYGARDGVFAVMHSVCRQGDTVLVDGNYHYSTMMAAERAGLQVVTVPESGPPEHTVDLEEYVPLIERHRPSLVILTHPDGHYGNLPDARRLGEIAREHRVPYLVNAAYAIGRMPVNMEGLGADFIVGSGHKSMASLGPSGVLGMARRWESCVLRRSSVYDNKMVELLGCTLRGAPLVTLMASFPEVRDRTETWNDQVAKARWFSTEMEALGFTQHGEKPHRHDLLHFETPSLYQISRRVRQRGYFLHKELRERRVWGPQPGLTRGFKVSTFAAGREQLQDVVAAFRDILDKYGAG
ncbi:MAG: O-phospho-L-seryl-tRNA:Cys-tRNA synthase [Chloroflexota bacterium]